ncbi:MAG: sulfide/dihydroorotate dehydrogenase-like FAD/NAD-binding protein [Treponema sp.]|jgi:ferredoxin--NADP+ reductase|nr:sulfide/dihydroorotate dehydrogenase-like FAD/NAD-binding protein [Treponema sp.]
MVKVIQKKSLSETVTLMEVSAPLEAAKAEPGQFVILRSHENGERIPLTIAGFNREQGIVTIIFQIVGAATYRLNQLQEGDHIADFVGPLGKATDCSAAKVAIVGGGVGSAIAYPVAKKFHDQGSEVHAIIGFRSKDLIILEEEFKKASDQFALMTDDGSYGRRGLVTDMLQLFIDNGERYDEVIAIGPLVMMKFVAAVTKPYRIKTTVSMNPIMIDGTGMCGGCRLTVGGKTKFACVDGPDFDGHEVDFNEAIARAAMYRPFELKAYEACKLFEKDKEARNSTRGVTGGVVHA